MIRTLPWAILFFLIWIPGPAPAQNTPGPVMLSDSTYRRETLNFSAGFRLFSAGEASMVLQLDTLRGDIVYHLSSLTRTNSFLDRFYRVRDRIDSWLNPADYALLRVDTDIREGRYRKSHAAVIDTLTYTAISGKDTLSLPGIVYEPISVIYRIRTEELYPGRRLQYHIYDQGRVREIYVTVGDRQRVAVPAGFFDCYVVQPTAADGKLLLKNKGQMKVWISTDERRLPVRIEQKTNVGTMLLELEEVVYEERRRPLYKPD